MLFTRIPVLSCFEVDKTCVDVGVFGLLARFLEKLLNSENSATSGTKKCSATFRTKIALGIIQLWFGYPTACFFKALGIYFSGETGERCHGSYCILSLASLRVYVDDHPSVPIFQWRPEHQATWHTRVSQRAPLFKVLSISGRILSQPVAFAV